MKQTSVTSTQDRRGPNRGGILFGLLFFAVGAGFLLLGVIPNLWDALRMRDWVPVPAEVVAADLESNDSSDSTTYKVTARFAYDYNGRHYSGDRVGIADGGSDNVGDWQRATWHRLKDQTHTRLWVNQGDPSESVFDRDLRWGLLGFKMLFVVVFGGFGAAVLWFSIRTPKSVPTGLPAWQARAEWHDNRIRSSARSTLWSAWGFALFWNAISSPIPFFLPAELARGNQLAWIAVIFPLIGFGLLVYAIRQTLNWRRFGRTLLEMDPFPGAIGADVGGMVELKLAYHSSYLFVVTLTCQHAYRRRSRNGSQTVRDVKWQDEQRAEVRAGMQGTRLHFLFHPPAELPESSAGHDSWDEWTVQVSANLPGTDFERSWEVPVFINAGPQNARNQIRGHRIESGTRALSSKLVRVRETGAGVELYYPYLRHPGLAFGTLLTGAGFAGFAWLFHTLSDGDGLSRLFIGLFVLAGGLILAWGLYLPGNSLRVTADRQGLTTVRGIFGLHFTRHVDAGEIAAIEKSIGMQASQGNQSRAYYRIEVHGRDGRRTTAGAGIPGASNVDAIIQKIKQALDLPGLKDIPGKN